DRTRRDLPRRVHLGARPEEKAHAVHPPIQQAGQAGEVEILRYGTSHCFRFKRYSPLVTDGDLGAMFSRRETKKKLADNIADLFQSHKGFNWWHRTIGTQYEKAQRNAHFGRVFDRAQSYLDDISDLANRAADFAPSILPKLNGIRDAFKMLVS